jgi:5-oxoprolinase (ATP-hydrolysing)
MLTRNAKDKWQFWVDRGGTFTDLIARYQGQCTSLKLLSENPHQYQDSVLEGMKQLMQQRGHKFEIANIERLWLGTTITTNALLEHKGARVLLITTKGFADAASIGYQNRADIFALNIKKPEPLYHSVIELDERLTHDGEQLTTLDSTQLQQQLPANILANYEAVAVCLLHSYLNPVHELLVEQYLQELGVNQISLSHKIAPQIKLVPRLDTCLVNAYLSPLLSSYCGQLIKLLPNVEIAFMQSSGGMINAQGFLASNSIMSGPAAGVVGMVETAKAVNANQIIGFDMGGTSTDICVYDQRYQYCHQKYLAGYGITAPMLDIHTIAAGVGSLLRYQDKRLQVGPESAGAMPGPCCYGNQGPLTLTDAQLLLGRIQPALFPKIFGATGDSELDVAAASKAFEQLSQSISEDQREPWTVAKVARGFIDIAVMQMASAIKRLLAERGLNASHFLVNCFGGAAGQHACDLANALGIDRFMLHPSASVLSALGIGHAKQQILVSKSYVIALDQADTEQLHHAFNALDNDACEQLNASSSDALEINHRLSLCYRASEQLIELEYTDECTDDLQALAELFSERFEQQYGYRQADADIEISQLSSAVSLTKEAEHYQLAQQTDASGANSQSVSQSINEPVSYSVYTQNGWQETPFIAWQTLTPGQQIVGPAVIYNEQTSLLVETNWQLEVQAQGELLLVRTEQNQQCEQTNLQADQQANPVTLELMSNLFMHIAEQMGEQLRRTASSVNIKERLDFSCALFDAKGQLIANAPHMPVHLGSMGHTVKHLLASDIELTPGSAFMSNDPYAGGTHLPDITVITPAFEQGNLSFFVASRGHHADVGGITPGSMPSNSTSIEQEGLRFDNVQIVSQGQFLEAALIALLSAKPYPARNIDQSIADIKAQLAANARGIELVQSAAATYRMPQLQAYFGFCLDNAEQAMRRTLSKLSSGSYSYPMDIGAKVKVTITVNQQQQQATVDFTGTSDVQGNNFNAPSAITRAAVLYVMRCLIGESIPLNDGCLRPVNIIIPQPSMLAPNPPAAVVAGNVETSQAITEALFGALSVLAGSAGTMTNLSFGNEQFQYYETIAGGSGAGADFHGTSGVQTHMTNSRITDPEIFENKVPVRLLSFSYRTDSAGTGLYTGGQGLIRRFEFLADCEANLLAGNHQHQPFGVNGGLSGAPGSAKLIHYSGEETKLTSTCRIKINKGDILEIKTPGGGGYSASVNIAMLNCR